MKYYDHDSDWLDRRQRKYPYWGPQSQRVYRQMTELLKEAQVPTHGLAIDVGCGAGAFGICLEALGYSYIGLDASSIGIELGKKDFPQLTLVHHDLVECPFVAHGSQIPQLVTSINALHCLVESTHRRKFLDHLKMLTGEGSYLLLTTMCAPFKEDLRLSKKPRAYLPVSEILGELRAAGFENFMQIIEEAPHGRNKVSNLIVLAKV